MSSKNLTPRQKMINMMYLVLIAMLALNVSREILKSFHLFELSFNKANSNLDDRNSETINTFKIMMANDKTKARTEKWYNLALEAQKYSKELHDYIELTKKEIIEKGGGRIEQEKNQSGLTELAQPDNMEKHAYYFMKEGMGKGVELQNKINSTRKKLIELLKEARGGEGIMKSLNKNSQLKAEDPTGNQLVKKTWSEEYLEQAPLAGVVTMLTKIQNDCKILETDVLTTLNENINIETVINDRQVAMIIPESKYVMSGTDFTAKIALATFDSRSEKQMFVNGVPIKVNNGIGEYRVPAKGNTTNKINAKIESIDPKTGNTVFIDAVPVDWSSFIPSATISAEAMNVLFIGLDNPLSISVPGVTPANTIVTASNGIKLTNSGNGKYSVNPAIGSSNATTITVSAKMDDGTIKKMGEMVYRIKKVPQPKLKLGSLISGNYSATSLKAQQYITAYLEDFYFANVRYTVVEYTAINFTAKKDILSEKQNDNKTNAIAKVLANAKKGDRLFIDYIKVQGPSGIIKLDYSLSYTVN